MKRFRVPLIWAAGGLAVLAVLLAVAFSSGLQTWAVRRALASRTDIRGEIGRVDVGWGHVGARDVKLERDGAILTLPSFEAELPVFAAALRDRYQIGKLVAQGWTLDLSGWTPSMPAPRKTAVLSTRRSGRSSGGLLPSAYAADAAAPTEGPNTDALAGLLRQLQLPFDLSIDGAELAGTIVLPRGHGRTAVSVTGGAVGAGSEGKFSVETKTALSDALVSELSATGKVTVAMDSPRTFTRLDTRIEARASGGRLAQPSTLELRIGAVRREMGESYTVSVASAERALLALQSELPEASRRLEGSWKLDARDADVAPFLVGVSLPAFAVLGEGGFETDLEFRATRAAGKLRATVERLEAILPEPARVGRATIDAEIDVSRSGTLLAIDRLNAAVAGVRPVARVRALQRFEFNPATGELKADDANRELVDVELTALPLSWIEPFAPEYALRGSDVSGGFVALTRGAGMHVRTRAPLVVTQLSVGKSGQPLLAGIDLSLQGAADYTPRGWQAEITELTTHASGLPLLSVSGRAGRLSGDTQPLKATGVIDAHLTVLAAQPVIGAGDSLREGNARLEFAATRSASTEVQTKLTLRQLVAVAETGTIALPSLAADIRADITPNGTVTLKAPLVVEQDGRKSDLAVSAKITPETNLTRIESRLTSENLVLDDVQKLAALIPASAPGSDTPTAPETSPAAKPFWADYRGTVGLDLKRLVYSEAVQLTNVSGTLRLDENGVKLEGMRSGFLDGGNARLDGAVTFAPNDERPFALAADVTVNDFNPGALLQSFNPEQPPTVEGRFSMSSKLAGRADSLPGLPAQLTGRFNIASRGGVFRGLPVNVGNVVENTNALASWLASAGSMIGALTGRREYTEVANKAQAVAEFAKGVTAISYDQLAVELTRDAQLNLLLKDFSLISPELRLTGTGTVLRTDDASLLTDKLAMEFTLRARGRQAELLKFVGVLEGQPDDLGYAACTVPVTIGGTLGAPDASEFSGRLAALALEKSGFADKAGELLSRIRGSK